MLLREIKKIFHKELDPVYGESEVSSFFYLLVEEYLGLERFVLAVEPNLVLDKQEEVLFFEALSHLKVQRPIQYILGKAHFMDMDFKVGPQVLIPRPETEELVRWIIDDCRGLESDLDILDLGTGSGCIAISLAKILKTANVQGLDISKEAVALAKENASSLGVEVGFLVGNIFNIDFKSSFDIIVSNPPYIRNLERKNMSNNVLLHEPFQALFVSDKDPLVYYRAIADYASKYLKPLGMLYLEINQYLGQETHKLLDNLGFGNIELRKDMFGNDRMIKAIKP